MINIQSIKNKSIGVTRKILNKLNSLNLQNYYFECSLIFMNVMQVLKTKRGCPIKQMYLELGQAPARFDLFKLRGFS